MPGSPPISRPSPELRNIFQKSKISSEEKLFPVEAFLERQWGRTVALLEAFDEIAQMVEADLVADFGNRQLGVQQQSFRLLQPVSEDVVRRRQTGVCLKELCAFVFVDVPVRAQLGDGQAGRVVLMDKIKQGLDDGIACGSGFGRFRLHRFDRFQDEQVQR